MLDGNMSRALVSVTRRRLGVGTSAWLVLTLGAGLVALYAMGPAALQMLVFPVITLGSLGVMVVGVRRRCEPACRRPWWALVGAGVIFFVSAVLRQTLPGGGAVPTGMATAVTDVTIIPGYLLMAYGLFDMLRRRRSTDSGRARADAFLLGIGSALGVWVFIIAPIIGAATVPSATMAMRAFYPMVDVTVLVITVQLVLTGAGRQPALWLLGGGFSALFVGDMLFIVYYGGLSPTSRLVTVFDVLMLVSYVLFAAAAIHPSMRTLTEPPLDAVRNLGRARIAGILAVLVAPGVLATLSPPTTLWNGVVRVVLSVLLALIITVRIAHSDATRADAQRAEHHRATHDTLTDLPNRELLAETITQWCERATSEGQEISLIFLDLDRFKVINDTWGHRVGDELLCAVAGRLSAAVRAEDLVCRIGGDEFVIALATPSHDTLAMSLAHRLIDEFAVPFPLSAAADVVVTASIGVARSAGAVQALELIRHADIAMYQAKAAGRGGVACFDTALDDQVTRRARLEQELRGAGERGELSVHYQPILNLATDELDGFEALMRWVHPELGFVSPVDFIPIAEVSGMIVPSGAWLLEEAARQMTVWQADRPIGLPPLHMSVNVSYRQLRDGSLVVVVRDVLERTGLPASALWLEITESGAMENPESSLDTLTQLHRLGVTLCIDDFGTGYSSLSYLRQFPADIVKIDRSFINGVGQNPDDEAIVRTVTAMTHALGRRVVVEGVETVEQRDWLRELGCDLVQGYLYGAPRAADKTDSWKLHTLTIPSASRVAV
jgi:diguanylate cyclase (GGDEF)-like protein